MENKNVTAESFTLRKPNGDWLGQIVITSDGMISGVTDWGNFAIAWRSFGDGMNDFKTFLLGISADYFGTKIYTGMNYMANSRKFQKDCDRIAEKILPALHTCLNQLES